MKKARVIVKTVSAHHQIYVEHNGERTLYAETNKLPMAKDLVLKAKRELGIARGSRALFQAKSGSLDTIPELAASDRLDDVEVLARHFLQGFATKTGRAVKDFTPAALDKILRDMPLRARASFSRSPTRLRSMPTQKPLPVPVTMTAPSS